MLSTSILCYNEDAECSIEVPGGPIHNLMLAADTFTKAREYTTDASMLYITANLGTVQRILKKARFHPKDT